jgi:hypothetical protein
MVFRIPRKQEKTGSPKMINYAECDTTENITKRQAHTHITQLERDTLFLYHRIEKMHNQVGCDDLLPI